MNETLRINRRGLYTASALYLLVPMIIFLFGWTRIYIAIPLTLLGIWMALAMFSQKRGEALAGSRKWELLLFVILALWVWLGGVGGYAWQNRWDHSYRNALYFTMFTDTWPLHKDGEIVNYYMGFWLLPALIAKIFKNLEVGFAMQYIWGLTGIWLAVRLVLDNLRRIDWRIIAVFILFSGMDSVGRLIYLSDYTRRDFHIEIWNPAGIMWESNTTMLYWVYNQVIPAWVATMLVFNSRRGWQSAGVMSLMSISAPFPMIGLLPIAILRIYSDARSVARKSGFWRGVAAVVSGRNISALIFAFPALLFMQLNPNVPLFRNLDTGWINVWYFILALILEIFIFLPLCYRYLQSKREFWAMVVMMAVIFCMYSLYGGDMISRAAIPLLTAVALAVAKYICNWRRHSLAMKRAFVVVAVLCLFTPGFELARVAFFTVVKPFSNFRDRDFITIYDESYCRSNFIVDRPDANPLYNFVFRPGITKECNP